MLKGLQDSVGNNLLSDSLSDRGRVATGHVQGLLWLLTTLAPARREVTGR